DLATPAADHHAGMAAAIEPLYKLSAAVTGEVRQLLASRVATQRLQLGVILVVAIAAFAGAAGLGFWNARAITRPIGKAVRVADAIAEGRLDQRIDAAAARNEEAGRLLAALSSMQGSLARLVREIQAASR